MKLKTYKNIGQCQKLWKNFSPNKNLFDFWEFRSCFYDKKLNSPHFIAAREGGKLVGLLPLFHLKESDDYTYFGDDFPERNYIFAKDSSKIPELLQNCPDETYLNAISPNQKELYDFKEDEFTYFVDLSKYGNSFEQYFGAFPKKKRKNFNRDLRNIPRYKVHHNRLKDYKRLIELNIKQFDDESSYHEKGMVDAIRKMINVAHRKKILNMISVEINGRVEGVDVGIKNGSWYTVVTGASNNQRVPNIGKLMTVLSIQNALKKRAKVVDFLASSGYWKNQWNFDKEMLLKYETC